MKKTLLAAFAIVSCLALSNYVAAKPNLGGGFTGPSMDSKITTVEQAKTMNDDAYVVMQGKIKQSIGHEKYLFEDQTGTIMVEIDDDDWNGISINEKDMVEIRGEVDTHWRKPTNIDVDRITKIQK